MASYAGGGNSYTVDARIDAWLSGSLNLRRNSCVGPPTPPPPVLSPSDEPGSPACRGVSLVDDNMPSEGAAGGDIDLARSSLSFGGIGIGSCGGCLCGGKCLRLIAIGDRETSLVCREC